MSPPRQQPPERRKPGGRNSPPIAADRGVFMISVAAELAEMHPQTLRLYEARGLITPKRSARNTRLYSQRDVEQLRRIQELTTDLGLNLAGVEAVMRLERELEDVRSALTRMRRRAEELEHEMLEEVERVRRSFRAEIVPYTGGGPLVSIPVKRPPKRGQGGASAP